MECIIPVQNLTGLKGGMEKTNSKRMVKQNSSQVTPCYLQLINRRNDCFVNSVIQFLAATGYASFLTNQLNHLLVGASSEHYKVSRLLAQLYSGQINGQVSSATIRRYVAQQSGKFYLDFGTQQDAEEFFHALEWTLAEELLESEDFRKQRDNHWGKKEIRRIFQDNTRNGKCQNCDQYPSSNVEPFLVMQLNVLQSASSINLSSIIESHFSESTHTEKIRCSNCCPHDRDQIPCTQTGICSGRQAAELVQLVEAPEFLLLQLLRYDGKGQKIKTFVKIEDELNLPGNNIYKPLAILNHIGHTQNSGHYVTYRKTDSGQWMFFNDTFNKPSSLQEANTADNYILLFHKNDVEPESFEANIQNTLKEDESKLLKKNKVHCIFVEDDETVYIVDNTLETEPQLLDKKCRGCSKIMERLLRHLNSKKGEKCMEMYTKKEIELHTTLVNNARYAKYRNKNKESTLQRMKRENILQNKKEHYGRERETILQNRKENYGRERENILKNRKEHYGLERENILENKKEHYARKRENILENKKEHYGNNSAYIIERKLKNYYEKKRGNMTMDESISAFKANIFWGSIYPCISCHRTRFRNGVTKANMEKLKDKTISKEAINYGLINKESILWIKNSFWICHTCQSYIKQNKLPNISSKNALQVYDRPDFMKLTEVENVLIAPRINFIKMIKLPVSRMIGLRDRIVNVPITSKTIRQTVESLPRTLEEAQVIPISLRKKKSMVGSHFQQYVNPNKIKQAVKFLIGKYPFYEDIRFNMHKIDTIWDTQMDDCEEDMEECNLVNVKDDIVQNFDKIVEDCSEELDNAEETDYIKNDPVRKHQTETSESSLLLPEDIEAKIKTKPRKPRKDPGLILAPGEDQIPRNILKEKHPFVLHFPCLFPDGLGGLHDPSRKKRMTTQQWIMQRLLNVNPMFAENKAFLFSAVNYVEQEQLMKRMNIS